MRISSIQSYALNNSAVKTHSEKFTSKPVNYSVADSVSFTGRGSHRALSILLSAVAALGAVFTVGATKAQAAPVPEKKPASSIKGDAVETPSSKADEDIFIASTQAVPIRPTQSLPMPPTPDEYDKMMAEKIIQEAKDVRTAADAANERADALEIEAKRAETAAYISRETLPASDSIIKASGLVYEINKDVEIADKSIQKIEANLALVEKAVENGKINGVDADTALGLVSVIRAGIEEFSTPKDEAAAVAGGLEEKTSDVKTLRKYAIDAAKDGVYLGTVPKILKSGEELDEATAVGKEKLDTMKTAYADISKNARMLETLAAKNGVTLSVSPVIWAAQPIVDTIEGMTGKTREEVDASIARGHAQMAKISADNLNKKADALEQKAKAYSVILEGLTAKSEAQDAASKVEDLEAELEGARDAAVNSRDAVPARIAGRNAKREEVLGARNSANNLNYIIKKGEDILGAAKEAGVDEDLIDNVIEVMSKAVLVAENTEEAAAVSDDAATAALNAKNKEEADAALEELDAAKALAKEASETADEYAKKLATAINELVRAVNKANGSPKFGTVSAINPHVMPLAPNVCGSLEIYGLTDEEVAVRALESRLTSAKDDAEAAQAKYDALKGDVERAKALLILLQSEETNSDED